MIKTLIHIVSFHSRRVAKNILNSRLLMLLKLRLIAPTGLYDKTFSSVALNEQWQKRISDVMACPDNNHIKRHPLAGTVRYGKQVMHNGHLINTGSYYGAPITEMLRKNKGVHEPQEELAFEQVLKYIPEGATMIELGSYWSFYSIWFNKAIPKAKNYMIEPEKKNILYGIDNFRLNGARGRFKKAFVSKSSYWLNGNEYISVDDYLAEEQIHFVDVLHSDIQGFELEMLFGATKSIQANKIGYFFISTHGNEIHYECLRFLVEKELQILCSADEHDTYSLDGLIVAKSPAYPGP